VPPETDSFIWGQQDEHVIPFSVGWDGAAWHVTTDVGNAQSSLSNPMCDAASGDVGTLLVPIVSGGLSYDLFPAPSLALGCLIVLQQYPSLTTPSPAAQVPGALFLHRFGVLIAVNDVAQRLLPYLPTADAYEMQLVKQIVPVTSDIVAQS